MEIQSEHAGGLRALPRISLTPEEAAASTEFSVRLCTPQPVFNELRAIPCTKSKTTITTRNNRGVGDG
jgi:hypothetical protein